MTEPQDIPPPAQVGAFWDAQARAAEGSALAQFGTVTTHGAVVAYRDLLERTHLERLLRLTKNSRVLDLGGGAGRIALWLAPRVAEVTLVDVSRELLHVAERTAQERGIRNLQVVHGSVLEVEPEPASYDAVLVMGVCCHLTDNDVERLAGICRRALKSGGRLYLKEPVTTDGELRVDERVEGGVPYRVLFRPREWYRERFGRELGCVYQEPTCAHVLPWFMGGTEAAAQAASAPFATRALTAVAPHLVRIDPWLQRLEDQLRNDPRLASLLAPVPVLQDFYVFETAHATTGPATASGPAELSIVVIAYNEEECLAQVTHELRDALDRRGIAYEIVLVDDGSSDGTLAQMRMLEREDVRTKTVPLQPNRGIGGALRAGFDAATGSYVTWIPADGQIGPEVILALYERRKRAPMITTVYRSRDDAWYRHAISGTLNRLIKLRTGQVAKSGGNYLFERSAWLRHAPREDDSMMISTALRNNLRAADETIEELEINARARVAGHSKVLNLRTIGRTLKALGKLGR
jgi:SAM-dependent methyltransferase